MAISKFGFGAVNSEFNSTIINREDIFNKIDILNSKFIVGRVTDIIISNTHPKFNQFGGWTSIGTVFFQDLNNLGSTKIASDNPSAKPLMPNIVNYPLINEIVTLFLLPGKNIDKLENKKNLLEYYYLNTVSVWNHPHMNAYPNLLNVIQDAKAEDFDYQRIEGGTINRPTNFPKALNLNSPSTDGGSFIERSNIHPLLSFAGDVIHEGRWGNSLRFGSTVPSGSISGSANTPQYQNNWSNAGESGDPITILRNGQPYDASSFGALPIIENIKKDLSSIYLTSTQQIPLIPASEDYSAFSTEPLLAREFTDSQIILNSGRLFLNSHTDSIFASSQNLISLTANKQIGITSNNVVINGDNIQLGSKDADDPALLGGSFIQQFQILVEQIQVLAFACSSLEGYDSESTNIETSGVSEAGQALDETCKNILDLLPKEGKITSPLLSNTIRLK